MNIYENKHKICEETEKKNLFHSKVFFYDFSFPSPSTQSTESFFHGQKNEEMKNEVNLSVFKKQ